MASRSSGPDIPALLRRALEYDYHQRRLWALALNGGRGLGAEWVSRQLARIFPEARAESPGPKRRYF